MSTTTNVIVGIAVPIGLLLFTYWFLKKILYIVHQAEGVVVQRLGKFHRVLEPGVNVVWPFLDETVTFAWRKTYVDVNRKVRDENINCTRIDLRESVFNFFPQSVYTKDTVPLEVNCVMYYSISDVRKAIYEVDDLTSAVSNTAQTQLKDVFGSMTFAEALGSQDAINSYMKRHFSSTFDSWGVKVWRIELQDMKPSEQTANAMKKQMVAERERRADFIEAEGNKAAQRLRSEGDKIKKINLGVAHQEATRKKSEGSAQAQVEIARAEKAALDAIADAITQDNCSQTEYMIAKRYNELFRQMMMNPRTNSKTMYLPYEIKHLSGMVADLPKVYGKNSSKALEATQPRNRNQDQFNELS